MAKLRLLICLTCGAVCRRTAPAAGGVVTWCDDCRTSVAHQVLPAAA